MEVKFTLNSNEYKDLTSYCNLNDLLISQVVKDSFTTGFNIERYGLLNATQNKVEKVEVIKEIEIPVEKIVEVIKEVPVERIVEITKEVPVERIVEIEKEIPVEKIVIKEVIKEVPIEKVVEKIVNVSDDTQINELLLKIQQLENRPPKIVEVIKEVPIEVIKEVIVEKKTDSDLLPKIEALQTTLQKLKQENIEKDRKLQEYEKIIGEFDKFQEEKKALSERFQFGRYPL